MAQIEANGVTLCYAESGSGEPLVLIHGANNDRRQFDWFRPYLGEGIRAIAYDQRDSPDTVFQGKYAMEDHAYDAARLIEKVCGPSAHIFGTSYGGAVGMTLAGLYPQRVKSLIIGATAPCFAYFRVPDVASVAAPGEAAVKRFMLEHFFTPAAIAHDHALMAAVSASNCERSPESTHRRMAALAAHDFRERLHLITAPTLVLQGEEDPIIALETSRALAGAIAGAELVVLPGVRHAISMERADKTARIVRQFVLTHA